MEEYDEKQSEQIEKLENAIKKLPVKLRYAIYWAVENYDSLEKMGRNSKMTFEEIQKAKVKALAEENYATLMLLHITEYVKQSTENEEGHG